MLEDFDDAVAAPPETPRRGRGKAKRARRNYADELRKLEARVEMAVRVLDRIGVGSEQETILALIIVAKETLLGEP